MNAYDIVLTDDNKLEIIRYSVELIRDKENNAFYHFDFVDSQDVEDFNNLPTIIQNLKQRNYFCVSRLEPTSFILEEGSAFYNMRALLLPYGNKLLDRVYDEVIINGICHVFVYVVYVNYNTGELFVVKANDMGIYSENLESNLEDYGYKFIRNSLLANYISDIDLTKAKAVSLSRVKQ